MTEDQDPPVYYISYSKENGFIPFSVTFFAGGSIYCSIEDDIPNGDKQFKQIVFEEGSVITPKLLYKQLRSAKCLECPETPTVDSDRGEMQPIELIENRAFNINFEDVGLYFFISTVKSPSHLLIVNVLSENISEPSAPRIVPELSSNAVLINSKMILESNDANDVIIYTLDGTEPSLTSTTKVYKDGVIFSEVGDFMIRAAALNRFLMMSSIFQSRRFFVTKNRKPDDDMIIWDRLEIECLTTFVEGEFLQVSWKLPHVVFHKLVANYQFLLNGIRYCRRFNSSTYSCLVSGLQGGCEYTVQIQCFSTSKKHLPKFSRPQRVECPTLCNNGGPWLSVEVSSSPDQLTLVWPPWTPLGVKSYGLVWDGKKVGENIVPEEDCHRCKLLIDECELNTQYSFYLIANIGETGQSVASNHVNVMLPIDCSGFEYPDNIQIDAITDDYNYREFIIVIPGRKIDDRFLATNEREYSELAPEDRKIIDDIDAANEASEHLTRDKNYSEHLERSRTKTTLSGKCLSDDNDSAMCGEETMDTPIRAETQECLVQTDPTQVKEQTQQTTGLELVITETQTAPEALVINEELTTILHPEIGYRSIDEYEVNQFPTADPEPILIARVLSEEEFPEESQSENKIHPPYLKVSQKCKDQIFVTWEVKDDSTLSNELTESVSLPAKVILLSYTINVIGKEFSEDIINSHTCIKTSENLLQHRWCQPATVTNLAIDGVLPGCRYRVFVSATYEVYFQIENESRKEMIESSSVTKFFTTIGSPSAPQCRITDIDVQQVTVAWDTIETNEEVHISSYFVFINDEFVTELPSVARFASLKDLPSDSWCNVQIQACTDHFSGNSGLSDPVRVRVPCRPQAPKIQVLETEQLGTMIIQWEPIDFQQTHEFDNVYFYSVYVAQSGCMPVYVGKIFVDDINPNGFYTYYVNDLCKGIIYDAFVKTHSGLSRISNTARVAVCENTSETSEVMKLIPPAPPESPALRILGMDSSGIDIEWEPAEEYGSVCVSGYQLLRNEKIFGSKLPSDQHKYRIEQGLRLGDQFKLKIVALTEHILGQSSLANTADVKIKKGPVHGYRNCFPGPAINVIYSGLALPPIDVKCGEVLGSKAIITWAISSKPKSHYAVPDYFMVTWWIGTAPDQEVCSIKITEMSAELASLLPNTLYTVRVESHVQVNEEGGGNILITNSANSIAITTGSPPMPVSNLQVVNVTCDSVEFAWNPPSETNNAILGYNIVAKCISKQSLSNRPASATSLWYKMEVQEENSFEFEQENEPISILLEPEKTSCIVDNLMEMTDYEITVTVLFSQSDAELNESAAAWLPSVSIRITTKSSLPARTLLCARVTPTSSVIRWHINEEELASNVDYCLLEWYKLDVGRKGEDIINFTGSLKAGSNATGRQLLDLQPGVVYKVDLTCYTGSENPIEFKSCFFRTPAPLQPPTVFLTSYSSTQLCLEWNRPTTSPPQDDEQPTPRRFIVGYNVYVNGRRYKRLGASAQTCFLTKCLPEKNYRIAVSVLTMTFRKRKNMKIPRVENDDEVNENDAETEVSSVTTFAESLHMYAEDESMSETLNICLPSKEKGKVHKVSCSYTPNPSFGPNQLGYLHVEWSVYGSNSDDELGVKCFEVSWVSSDEEYKTSTVNVRGGDHWILIPVRELGTKYNITVSAETVDDVISTSQSISYQVIGPPDPPFIWLYSVSERAFIIEWNESASFGSNGILGYQFILNGRNAGNRLHRSHCRALVPCQANKKYEVQLVALSSDPSMEDSEPSQCILVSTFPDDIASFQSKTTVDNKTEVDKKSTRALSPITPLHNITIQVLEISDSTITIAIQPKEYEGLHHFKIQWSSVNDPSLRVKIVDLDCGEVILDECQPGSNHFVRVFGLSDSDVVLAKSKQLTILTAAALGPPSVEISYISFSKITIYWSEPTIHSDALVSGYKVFVNDKQVAETGPEVLTYDFMQGNMCREYRFQVQALSSLENLDSELSTPVVAIWPGLIPPKLTQLPTTKRNSIRVGWAVPFSSGNVQLLAYWAYCVLFLDEEDDVDKKITLGPLNPDTTEAEFSNLATVCQYQIYLELKILNIEETVRTESVYLHPALHPHAPSIRLVLQQHSEKLALDKSACQLFNRRDALLRMLQFLHSSHHNPRFHSSKQEDKEITQIGESLAAIDSELTATVRAALKNTGKVDGLLTWEAPSEQGDEAVEVVGYRVLINGQQYGQTVDRSVNSMLIRMTTEKIIYKISLLALTSDNSSNSPESNIETVSTESYLPFSVFCYFKAHNKNARWPSSGSCALSDSLPFDRKQIGHLADGRIVCPGIRRKHELPPAISVYDLMNGSWDSLVVAEEVFTVIMFWTTWCIASRRLMKFFINYASSKFSFNFLTVCVASGETGQGHHHKVRNQILSFNSEKIPNIRHCCGCFKENTSNKSKSLSRRTKSENPRIKSHVGSGTIEESFSLQGVPTLAVIHPNGFIYWQGRVAAFEYSDFALFMDEALEEVQNAPSRVSSRQSSISEKKKRKKKHQRHVQKGSLKCHSEADAASVRSDKSNSNISDSSTKRLKTERINLSFIPV